MPQINILPLDVATAPESKGRGTSSSSSETDSGHAFSQMVEREIQTKESGKKSTSGGNEKEIEASRGANSNEIERKNSKESDKLADEHLDNQESIKTEPIPQTENSQQNEHDSDIPVISSDNKSLDEAKQLMSFLSASDKALAESRGQAQASLNGNTSSEEAVSEELSLTQKQQAALTGNEQATQKGKELLETRGDLSNKSINSQSKLESDITKQLVKEEAGNVGENKAKLTELELLKLNELNKENKPLPKFNDNEVVQVEKTKAKDNILPIKNKEFEKVVKEEVATEELSKFVKNKLADEIGVASKQTPKSAENLAVKQNTGSEETKLNQAKNVVASENLSKPIDVANSIELENAAETSPVAEIAKDALLENKEALSDKKVSSTVTSNDSIDIKNGQKQTNDLALQQSIKLQQTPAEQVDNIITAKPEVTSEKQSTDQFSQQLKQVSQTTHKVAAEQSNNENSDQGSAKQDQSKLAQSISQAESANQKTSDELETSKFFEKALNEQNTQRASVVESLNYREHSLQSENQRVNNRLSDMMSEMVQETQQKQQIKTINTLQNETISIYRKDFSAALKDKVMIMVNQKIQQVDIQLDPPELGNVHVRLNLQNEQAAVNFVVQNQQAKEALEQNLGKLRDMLSEAGVDVGDADIKQQQGNEQEFSQSNDSHFDDQEDGQLNDMAQGQVVNLVKGSSTGVDYYA